MPDILSKDFLVAFGAALGSFSFFWTFFMLYRTSKLKRDRLARDDSYRFNLFTSNRVVKHGIPATTLVVTNGCPADISNLDIHADGVKLEFQFVNHDDPAGFIPAGRTREWAFPNPPSGRINITISYDVEGEMKRRTWQESVNAPHA